ncbi:hypothetical protein U1Q18_029984, partial [Sarracenia purpurea var. burkii]
MAPHRKLNRDASVSYDQTRFRSKAAEDRFNASYANRPLRSEMHVWLFDFADTPVPQWFEWRGWTPMLTATSD